MSPLSLKKSFTCTVVLNQHQRYETALEGTSLLPTKIDTKGTSGAEFACSICGMGAAWAGVCVCVQRACMWKARCCACVNGSPGGAVEVWRNSEPFVGSGLTAGSGLFVCLVCPNPMLHLGQLEEFVVNFEKKYFITQRLAWSPQTFPGFVEQSLPVYVHGQLIRLQQSLKNPMCF